MSTAHNVALVLDPDFGERLRPLAIRMHVWISGTDGNRRVAEEIWAENKEYSLEQGVTTMAQGDDSAEGFFATVLWAVNVHHGEYSHDPVWTVLHIYGIEPTKTVLADLAAYGATEIERTGDHFVATRIDPRIAQY
jgi:hypothetical protein